MHAIKKYPAKLILFGEHSVLRGHKCISAAINILSECTINKKSSNKNIIVVDTENTKIDLSFFKIPKDINIKLGTALGSGLGTSAVVSLIFAENMIDSEINIESLDFLNKSADEKIINLDTNKNYKILDLALKIENYFHGKSSGVDVASIFETGLISYKNKSYRTLNTNFLRKYKIMIFDSNIRKNTKKIIEKLLNIDDYIYETIGKISEKAERLLCRNFTLSEIYVLMKENHDILFSLGLVPEFLQNEVLRLRNFDIESKITGAGMGGFLYTIVEKELEIDGWQEVEIYDHQFLDY